jgi:glycosyltransferase involved in cell wall biosynthesis
LAEHTRVTRPLRIAVHDYGAYPFAMELSRTLQARGHEIRHFVFAQNTTPNAAPNATPNGRGDATLFEDIRIQGEFDKYSLWRRRSQERRYGAAAAKAMANFAPDIVISANTPIDAQARLAAFCRSRDIPMVFWLQDVISVAMERILTRKYSGLGALVGRYYRWLEAALLRQSAAVVAIADDFLPICQDMGVEQSRCHVIENWAPLSQIRPRRNAWSAEMGLSKMRTILYSGTIGFKHNPRVFEQLSLHFATEQDVKIVVVSEGPGADWLTARKAELGLGNLLLLPYQPYERLPEMLASGDVLLAVLDDDAGAFSVPSKVLTYLAVGRPVLLAVPAANRAAEIVREAEAGRIVGPRDELELVAAARELMADGALRDQLGSNARAYAERRFAIEAIADRFERVLEGALGRTPV